MKFLKKINSNNPISKLLNSVILKFCNPLIRQFDNSLIRQFSNSTIRQFAILLAAIFSTSLFAQTPELETAQSYMGRIWGGFTAVGDNANFNRPALFFPNDYDIIFSRGQSNDNYFGTGFRLAATDWLAPNDSLYPTAVFGPKSEDFDPDGKVITPLTNYVRYQFPVQSINGTPIPVPAFGTYNPDAMNDGTYDQVLESTYKNIIGVEVKRKVMIWSQSFNDNYVIIDVELTNVGVDGQSPDTLNNFYMMMQMGTANNYYSNTFYNPPQSNEAPKYQYTWQHYYGARSGDSLRVFYSYHADDPTVSGDDMGSPLISQNGRLVNTNFIFYTILHASKEPYLNASIDENDPLQPKITYIGTDTKIPNLSGSNEPRNFWAIRGGFSDTQLMPDSYDNTHHYINNDELGVQDFSNFVGGTTSSTNSKNFSSFGPYNFPPNHKLRIVYAVGVAGIGLEKAAEIGRLWLNGTLENPPDMPDPNTGWLPTNFAFPSGATEQDKRKDRWISRGLDSVMLTAYRAKWNFEHNYQIPKAPPPPERIAITGYGDTGVEIIWSNPVAENMSDFSGYRILRRQSNQDTVFYKEIYSSGPEDKTAEHHFTDNTVIKTVPYYYYVQTKLKIDENDLNADPTTRGKIMYSGRCLVPNASFIRPPNFSTEDMSKIRIVPNPYNINDPLVKAQFVTTDYRQINFMSLPAIVTIKIYTENGDLVKTIEHNRPNEKDGFESWDMITDNQQVISSGIYIAVFQKPSSETSYQKFIVVR